MFGLGSGALSGIRHTAYGIRHTAYGIRHTQVNVQAEWKINDVDNIIIMLKHVLSIIGTCLATGRKKDKFSSTPDFGIISNGG